ncbi:MAG: hypothetical protein E6J54_29200, partial [Deltaproteobacteria bacterium]
MNCGSCRNVLYI